MQYNTIVNKMSAMQYRQ